MRVRPAPAPAKPNPGAERRGSSPAAPHEVDLDAFVLKTAGSITFDPKSALWQHVIASSISGKRAQLCLELLDAQLGSVSPALVKDAALLVWAAATTKDGPDSEGLIVPIQAVLALRKLSELSRKERAQVDAILARAASAPERAVLLKAISARAARPVDDVFLAELQEVERRIRQQPLEWLLLHTTGYGIGRPLAWVNANSSGEVGTLGNRQPHPLRCQLTVRDLAEAEFDPLMALRISMDPSGRSSVGSFADRHQGELIDAFMQDVLPKVASHIREDYHPALDVVHYLGSTLSNAGFTTWRDVPWAALSRKQRRHLLDDLEIATLAGFKTLIRIVRPSRRGPSSQGVDVPRHFEAIVDVRRAGGTRLWRIHDPDPSTKKKARYVKDQAFLQGPFLSVREGRFVLERLFAVAAALPDDAPGALLIPEPAP